MLHSQILFALVAWLVVAVDVGLAACILLRPWKVRGCPEPIRITATGAAGAIVAVAAAFAAKFALSVPLGVNIFGLIRLAYMDCVVTLPAAGVIVLAAVWSGRWRAGRGVRALSWFALLAAPVGIYATFIEPFRLQLETPTLRLPASRGGHQPIMLGVLADIQTADVGEYEQTAIELLMRQSPDIILIPGDLWHGEQDEFPEQRDRLRALFGQLHAPGGVYFSSGNLDQWLAPDALQSIFDGTAVRMLQDEIVRVRVRDREVTIAGIAFGSRQQHRVLQEIENVPGTEDIRILSAHLPDTVLQLRPDTRVDLVVSGHTHGGQVVLPGFGPLMTLSQVPRQVAAGGLHELSGRRIYVSRGVGCERGQGPRLRLLCPPEVSLIRLE